MATKALTTVLVVQAVSTASLTSIPYGLILADANRFIGETEMRSFMLCSQLATLLTQRREMVRDKDRVRTDCIVEADSICSRPCLERRNRIVNGKALKVSSAFFVLNLRSLSALGQLRFFSEPEAALWKISRIRSCWC